MEALLYAAYDLVSTPEKNGEAVIFAVLGNVGWHYTAEDALSYAQALFPEAARVEVQVI